MSSVCYAEVIFDEICLEGLDGITLESLWERLRVRMKLPLSDKIKLLFWKKIQKLEDIEFYELPKPRPTITNFERNSFFELGDFNCTRIYPFHPATNAHGSCEFFNERIRVKDNIREKSLEDVITRWSDTLVLVGSVKARWRVLSGNQSMLGLEELTPFHYCLLERIGRSRYNGEFTIGQYSLNSLGKDSKHIFYFRKKLLTLGIITKQKVLLDKQKFISSYNMCLHLSRFYIKIDNEHERIVDKIINFLNCYPRRIAPLIEFKNFVRNEVSEYKIKTFFKNPKFNDKIVVEKGVPYRQVYPDATEKEWMLKANGLERKIAIIRIKEDYKPSPSEPEVEEIDTQIAKNIGSTPIGEPLLRSIYLLIRKSGVDGSTLLNLKNESGLDHLIVRLAVRLLIDSQLVFNRTHENNRQKTERYYSHEYTKEAMKDYETLENKIKILSELNEPSRSDTFDNNVTTTNPDESKLIFSNITSLKKLRRINMIMELLHEKQIIFNISDIGKYINEKEANAEGVIDKRSLHTLLKLLEKNDQLKILRIKVPVLAKQLMLMYVCEPHIDTKHPYIQSAIQQTKSKYLIRNRQDTKPKKKILSMSRSYGFVPKFARLKLFHEFLFYIVYECQKIKCESPAEIQEKCEMHIVNDIPPHLQTDLEKKYLFATAITEYVSYPRGWFNLSDIIAKMPIWLLVKIVNVNYHVPELDVYLKHAIKSQLLLENLPETMKSNLLSDNRHIPAIWERCVSLCFMGLVKFGKKYTKDKSDIFIYLNSQAMLWDTTSTCPGYHKVEDKEYPREDFKFETIKDIQVYWDRTHSICTNTLLGERYAALGEIIENESLKEKLAYALREYTPKEVLDTDIFVPGDGCGAGGFDSAIFAHLKRSWNYSIETSHKIKSIKRKSVDKNIVINYVRKKPLLARGQNYISTTKKRSTKSVIRTINPRKIVVKKVSDEIDKKAMKLLGMKRCTWNEDEEKIIFLAIIANRVINPSRRLDFCSVIRDVLHGCTNSVSKSTSVCRRRINNLMKKVKFMRKVELNVAEIRHHPTYKKYFTLIQQKNTNNPEQLTIFQIHFIELISHLHSRILGRGDNLLNITFPNNIEDLHNFTVETTSVKSEEPRIDPTVEIQMGVLTSIIHSALGSLLVKDVKKFLLLQTYSVFPDELLISTLQLIRTSGMIAHKKLDEVKLDRKKLEINKNIVIRSQYKLSINYVNNLAGFLAYKVFSQIYECIKTLKSKRCMVDGTLNGGTTAALLELASIGYVSLELSTPENVIVIDPRYAKGEQDFLFDDISNDAFQGIDLMQLIEKGTNQNSDMYMINSCNLTTNLQCEPDKLTLLNPKLVCNIINKIITDAVYYPIAIKRSVNDLTPYGKSIYSFIEEKREFGRTLAEIKEKYLINGTCTKQELWDILQELFIGNYIRRVGSATCRWISINYVKSWSIRAITCIDEASEYVTNTIPISIDDDTPVEVNTEINRKRKLEEKNDILNPNPKKVRLDDNLVENHTKFDKKCDDNTKNVDEGPSNDDVEKCIDVFKETDTEDYLQQLSVDDSILDDVNKILKDVYEDKEIYIFPRPWIRSDGSLNNRLLWTWMGAILNYLLFHPVCKFSNLCQRFKYMEKFHLSLLIEMMEDIQCVKKLTIIKPKVSLFSDSSFSNIVVEKSSPLDVEDTDAYVEIQDGALLKFSLFKGNII